MYTITIVKSETKNASKQSYEKIADTGNEKDGGPIYGYVSYGTTNEIETLILTQTLEDINLPQIIKAINSL